ncbi:MAG: nucleoside hydrolase [Bacteroidota bacterium]
MKKIWVDTDLAIGAPDRRGGVADVDDGFALLHLMRSQEVAIQGISTVFGNTFIDEADAIAHEMIRRFGQGKEIPIFKGASEALDLQDIQHNPATQGLADHLKANTMAIMAIGPLTNIGKLLLLEPHLAKQIEYVVCVAGRRSTDHAFKVGPDHDPPFPDLNFELDVLAFQILLQHEINVVLLPFEISHKIWITEADLDTLSQGDEASQFLAKHSLPWLEQWAPFGVKAFNPFDVLASGYILRPDLFEWQDLYPKIMLAKDDMSKDSPQFKHYLTVTAQPFHYHTIRYCHDTAPAFKSWLMNSLMGE